MTQSLKEDAEKQFNLLYQDYEDMKKMLEKSQFFDMSLSEKLNNLLSDTHLTIEMQGDLFRSLLSRLRGLYINDYFSDELHMSSSESEDSSESEQCSKVVRLLKNVRQPIDHQVCMQIYLQIRDFKNEVKFTVIDFLLKNTNIEQNNIQFLVCLCWPDFTMFNMRAHKDLIMQSWLQALDIFLTHPKWKDGNLEFMDKLDLSFFADNQTIGAQVAKSKDTKSRHTFWLPAASPTMQRLERFNEKPQHLVKVC